MWIIKNKKVFLSISAFLLLSSIILLTVFKLKLSIDFTGGAQTEITYTTKPTNAELSAAFLKISVAEPVVQEIGSNGFSIKTVALNENERQSMFSALSQIGQGGVIQNFTSIGPSVGQELVKKSLIAILLVSLTIILFIAYAFRHVSKPVSSLKYGLIAIVTLAHDILIPSGVFALLGKYGTAEVDTLFVVALLTVLGLSVSDTIVVFDRIRENLRTLKGATFEHVVGKSLEETFTRSINTSLTVIVALVSLYFFGPDATKNFSLVLIVGMFFGTYSSIFIASPLLTLVEKWQRNK